jgi:hypothetical protein
MQPAALQSGGAGEVNTLAFSTPTYSSGVAAAPFHGLKVGLSKSRIQLTHSA